MSFCRAELHSLNKCLSSSYHAPYLLGEGGSVDRWGCDYSETLGESRLDKTGNTEKKVAWGKADSGWSLRPGLSSLEEWRKGALGTSSAGGCVQPGCSR